MTEIGLYRLKLKVLLFVKAIPLYKFVLQTNSNNCLTKTNPIK